MINLKKKLQGKKLLLLGSSGGTCDIVNYARSQGAYVIVTDNLPPEKSAAKQIADEAWPVSTADADTLERLAIQHKINGIFAGVSEFNLEKAMTLCERLGLPFYCNRKQWEICSNKQRFKQLCRANGIPVAKDYHLDSNFASEDLKQIQYPVIVKPVDSSSSDRSRYLSKRKRTAESHIKEQYLLSKTKLALVENLVTGDEFIAAYTIKNGEFSLSFVIDKYVNPGITETINLPQTLIAPSKYTDRYIMELNKKVIVMFQNIGLTNGFIFIQGKINEDGFHIIETNYRPPGFSWYHFSGRTNGINYLEMLVDYALTGKMGSYDLGLNNPKFNRILVHFSAIIQRRPCWQDTWLGRDQE